MSILDANIHAVIKGLQNARWRDFEKSRNHEWYYAEDRLYVIRRKATKEYFFVHAGNPEQALDHYINRRYVGVFTEVTHGEG